MGRGVKEMEREEVLVLNSIVTTLLTKAKSICVEFLPTSRHVISGLRYAKNVKNSPSLSLKVMWKEVLMTPWSYEIL